MVTHDPPAVGLSLMMQDDFRIATAPLFDSEVVDVVEWSFDMAWGIGIPDWLGAVLNEYSRRNRLLGHGVSYSVLDAGETNRQEAWLQQLTVELLQHNYCHISEHFGFMGGGNFHRASPLPVPRTESSLEIGRERLQKLAKVTKRPVGLENLAFAFHLQDVWDQGPFLDALLEPVDGFLLLDLHNLYCHAQNFNVEILELLERYPLDRVLEIHVSGGSWSQPLEDAPRVRRDTHDDLVPQEIFDALPHVLDRCRHLEYVILERMDGTIVTPHSDQTQGFRQDFLKLKAICQGHSK